MTEVENRLGVDQVSAYLKVPVATLYGWRTKTAAHPAKE